MILAKFDCQHILVQAPDGRLFVANIACLDKMEEVQESPPKEDEDPSHILPFLPRKTWFKRLFSRGA